MSFTIFWRILNERLKYDWHFSNTDRMKLAAVTFMAFRLLQPRLNNKVAVTLDALQGTEDFVS